MLTSVGAVLAAIKAATCLDSLAAAEAQAAQFLEHQAPSNEARSLAARGIQAQLDAALERLCLTDVAS